MYKNQITKKRKLSTIEFYRIAQNYFSHFIRLRLLVKQCMEVLSTEVYDSLYFGWKRNTKLYRTNTNRGV